MITATATLSGGISVTAQISAVQTGTCADGSATNSDGSFTLVVPSGDLNVPLPNITLTQSDGTVTSIPSVKDVTCQLISTVTVGVFSTDTHTTPITGANANETVFLKAFPNAGFTPTNYLFYFKNLDGSITNIYDGASDKPSWVVVGGIGIGSIQVAATDDNGVTLIGQAIDFEIEGFIGVMDAYNFMFGVSNIALRNLFASPSISLRRTSNNDTADFSRDDSVVPVRITGDSIASNGVPSSNDGDTLTVFSASTDAHSPLWYDQTTNANNVSESTVADQPKAVSAGALLTIGGFSALDFDGSSDRLNGWDNALAPVIFQSLGTSISIVSRVNLDAVSGTNGQPARPNYVISELRVAGSNGNIPFSFGVNGSNVQIGFASSSSFELKTSTATLSISTDYVLGVTINGNIVKLYIDGVLDSTHTLTSATGTRNLSSDNSHFNIGVGVRNNDSIDDYLDGRDSGLLISDEVFTDAEMLDISTNYNF
jgi:hypothetical protein